MALIERTLPRFRFPEALAETPAEAFAPAGADSPRVGPRLGALRLEIGFGGGEHAASIAAAHPGDGLIACEVFLNGLASLLGRLVPQGEEETCPPPAGLRLWDRDARLLIERLPAGALDAAFLLFPDPWPKSRHAKRRFLQPETVAALARAIRPGGEWRIASDHPVHQAWVAETMARQDAFVGHTPTDTRPDGWPPTRYEAKALREGRVPFYWRFVRRDDGGGTAGA